MKLFECQYCHHLLYFENESCGTCGRRTGYLPERECLSAVEPYGKAWTALADPGESYRFCANWEIRACNWLVKASAPSPYCVACQHNRTIPDVTDPARHALWCKMELAKRRLFYSLIKFRLPMPVAGRGDAEPLVFDFLDAAPGRKVLTGHENGLITIALAEANDAEREAARTRMGEPYRTLVGHFRHEVGHFYWDRLVRDGGGTDSFRRVFDDERIDYAAAMAAYYASGPLPDWQHGYVSAYATMHPWEDFAETWAHYLHIVDTMEMAYAFGITVAPGVGSGEPLHAGPASSPYEMASMDELMTAWIPINLAVNGLNRTMGQPDLYPFVVSPPVIRKLAYIRALIAGGDRAADGGAAVFSSDRHS